MNWKRIVMGVIVVILMAGGYWAYQAFPVPQPTMDANAANVNTDTIAAGLDTISAEGVVVPLAHADLAFQVSGEVAEILVEEGQQVQPGDPLIRLDSRDQEIILREAETAVLLAQAKLAGAQAQLAAAQVNLESANVAVTAAEVELNLLTADPTAEQIALQEALVAAAAAGIEQASGHQAVALEGATAAEIGVAEAELAAAQAQLFAVRLANEPLAQDEDAEEEEREQAQLRLNAAIANVAAAQANLDALHAGATDAERLAASGAVSAADKQRDAEQAKLALLLVGFGPEAIAVAQANLEQAHRAVAEAEIGVERGEADVAQAEAGVAEAETAVRQAQSALDKTILTAPFAGAVAEISVKAGEIAQPRSPVLTLADFREWRIQTIDLSELGVVNVGLQDEVTMTFDAFPGRTYHGHIADIAVTSDLLRDAVTYAVIIAPDEAVPPLRWGMTALVNIDGAGD